MAKRYEVVLGVDLYTNDGRLRADDLAVRSRAADLLAAAGAALAAAAAAYQREFIPAPSRENPFPSAEALAPARDADKTAKLLADCANRIRGQVFPPKDQVWKRLKAAGGPAQLLAFDRTLIGQAEYAADTVGAVVAQNLTDFGHELVAGAVRDIDMTLRDRSTWLASVT
jgi:hypothetical protein